MYQAGNRVVGEKPAQVVKAKGRLGADDDRQIADDWLLGFNLGIEVTQLLLVALMMPSLLVLARTGVYPAFRVGVALLGLVFSVSWMLERATLTASDPFEGVQTWLVEHPLLIAAAVAALAILARHPRRRVEVRVGRRLSQRGGSDVLETSNLPR